jgi:hypothetical protein
VTAGDALTNRRTSALAKRLPLVAEQIVLQGSSGKEENSPSIRDVPLRKNLFEAIAPFTRLLMLKYRHRFDRRLAVATLLF